MTTFQNFPRIPVGQLTANDIIPVLNGGDLRPYHATIGDVVALGGVNDNPQGPPASNVIAAVGSAGVLTGAYYYSTAFKFADGTVTAPWPGTATVVNPSSQQVNLTSIPIAASADVVARVIYRTAANPADPKAYLVAFEIPDNTTTTATDNTADGALGAPANWLGSASGTAISETGRTLAGLGGESQSLAIGLGSNAGYASVHIGWDAGKDTTTGLRNTSVGVYSLENVTTGMRNTTVGTHAGGGLTTANDVLALGYAAGSATKPLGSFVTLVGCETAGGSGGASVGNSCVALGYRALYNINTAADCIGIGAFAGQFANSNRQLFIDTQASVRADLAASQNNGLIYGEIPNSANVQTQRINLNGSVRLGSSTTPTVANLPAAATALQGCRRYVTDASVAYTSANLGSTVAGGGANCVPVFCNGTAWVIG